MVLNMATELFCSPFAGASFLQGYKKKMHNHTDEVPPPLCYFPVFTQAPLYLDLEV